MCGILFISKKIDLNEVKLSLNLLKNRGPDDEQLINYNDSWIGFTRLSINDLSNDGNQPFQTTNTILICNGEIYNHKYLKEKYNITTKSNSDCEVILHLYEKKGIKTTVKLLDGVFAFVLYDKTTRRTYACKDRIGIRPIFYQIDINFNFAFSSIAKPLEKIAISDTMQIPPGTYIEIIPKISYSFIQYYSISNIKQGYIKENKVKETLKSLLYTSIEKRLMSDRDIGCLLSGGVDSSIVAAILAEKYKKKGRKIKTFSVGFSDSVDLKYARKVAEFIDSDHHELIIEYENTLNLIPPSY